MKNTTSIFIAVVLSANLAGCASTKAVDLHDSLAVISEPKGATVYVKKLNGDFTTYELESNTASRVDNHHFSGIEYSNTKKELKNDNEELTTDKINSESVEVFTATTPARFSLHRKGHYAVAVVKDGFITQTQVVQDKLTGGEVAGNVAKSAGTVVAATAVSVLTLNPLTGLAVLAGSAAKKGQNVKSGKNRELSPNPIKIELEPTERPLNLSFSAE